MKFIEHYPDAQPGETVIPCNGDEIICHLAATCIQCDGVSTFSSAIFECPLCSEECYQAFYKGFVAAYNRVNT